MHNVSKVRARLAWRFWRRWMPERFRELYGDEMLQLHLERTRDRQLPASRFWAALMWDVLVTGLAARVEGSTVRCQHWRESPGRLWQELAHAGRRLRRQPAFAIGVTATLALAIGANLTMLSIVDRLLLRPPEGVEEASKVRRLYVHGVTLFEPEPVYSASLSYPEYRALTEVSAFVTIAAHAPRELTLGTGESARPVRAELTTASYFPLLGVPAAIGRLYGEEEDRIDAADYVVVLSHALWRSRYGGDPGVLGSVLSIGKGQYTVIGVAPPEFAGIDLAAVDLWLPLHAAGAVESGTGWMRSAGWSWISAVARLRDDEATQVVAAESEATTRLEPARAALPRAEVTPRVVLASLIAARGPNPMSEASITRVLAALAAMVLLIGCANVINLLLTRGMQRRRQFAVQRALGAGRARLAAELMSEALLLTVASAALALLIAWLLAPAVLQLLLPEAVPSMLAVNRTLLFAAPLVIAVVLFIGLIPSYQASIVKPMEAMKANSVFTGGGWLRRSLLFVQTAVSVFLLIGAGLFVRSLQRANSFEVGLATETLSVELELQDGTKFGGRLAPPSYAVLERLRAHPRVAGAAVTSIVPFAGGWGLEVGVPGSETIESSAGGPFFVGAGADYFKTVGLPLRSGRELTSWDDRAGAEPVAVVNEAMARLVWPGEDAIGKCLLVGDGAESCTIVVGVVANYLSEITAEEPTPLFYIAPHHPGIGFVAASAVLVRVNGDPGTAVPVIGQIARTASPDIRYAKVAPLFARLEPQLRAWRVGAGALTGFGLLALAVAAAGLYAVLSFEVTQRRFELAIRAALGASAGDLVATVLARTLLFTIAGMAAGSVAALFAGRMVQSLLFEVHASDPAIQGYSLLALSIVAVIAALIPIWRARGTDPMDAFRQS